jgi:hypothetical protein
VSTATRRSIASVLGWTEADELRAALAHEAFARSPRGRAETVRGAALDLATTIGEMLRGDADEAAVMAAERDLIAAIAARRVE